MKYYDIMKGFRGIVIAAVVFAAAGISASAQLSFQGGVTLPIQTFEEPGSQGFASRYGDGMYIGIDYNIHVVKGFYITPGLDYNYLSVSYSGDISGFNGTEQQVDHWVNIPSISSMNSASATANRSFTFMPVLCFHSVQAP